MNGHFHRASSAVHQSGVETARPPISGESPSNDFSPDLGSRDSSEAFDYEGKVWGLNDVGLSPTHLNAMRLRHCLADLNRISGHVLEVGCGGGGMVRAIQSLRPDLRVSGCDISSSAAAAARGIAANITYSTADGLRLPFNGNSFDAVVMFDVMEHVENPRDLVAEVSRVLRPEGVFHLFAPCEWNIHTLHGLLGRFGWQAKRIYAGHVQMFTDRGLNNILYDGGFQTLKVRWSGHLLNQLADVCYFSLLAIRGRNPSMSVESYVASAKDRARGQLLGFITSLIALLSYLESRVLWQVPGWGIHLELVHQAERRGGSIG